MSFTMPSRPRSGPRRRSLLAGAAAGAGAVLLAGCSEDDPSSDTSPQRRSAGERVRSRAARDSEELAARYDAVIAAHAPLAARLRPLRAEVARHAEAFGAKPSPSPSPSPSGTAATAVPAGSKDALSSLAEAERALADRRTKDLLDVPGDLARLLASVAAAGAAHAFLLTDGGAR
ncbi:hypothetical protein ACWCP6_32890 [Streptomyces sp. NPDC002004]